MVFFFICSVFEPVIFPSMPDQIVTVGENVSFQCSAAGIELSYKWTFDPEISQCFQTDPYCIQVDTYILTIYSIPASFSTTITCTVTDLINQTNTDSANLIVEGVLLVGCVLCFDSIFVLCCFESLLAFLFVYCFFLFSLPVTKQGWY